MKNEFKTVTFYVMIKGKKELVGTPCSTSKEDIAAYKNTLIKEGYKEAQIIIEKK